MKLFLDSDVDDREDVSIPGAFDRMMRPLRHRSWCITSKGYLGWAPNSATIGDVVAVIDGMTVLMLLRRSKGSEFTLVGDCYVHGIMDGEVVTSGEYPAEEICLV